jgi:hypothetical protein
VTEIALALTLGTATPGGGFPVYGDAVIAAVREVDPALAIEPRNTKGSTENVPLLEKNEVDLALVQGEVRAPSPIRIVAAMYSTPGMFGARGSGLVLLARYVLDGLGLDAERDFRAVYLDRAGDGPAMVQDGRVAALWGGGVEAAHRAGGLVPGSGGADRLARLVVLHHGAPGIVRRRGVSRRQGAARGGGGDRAAAAPGQGDDGGEHGRGRAACRSHPSRRAALPHRARPHALARSFGPGHAATLSSICRACSCRCTA